MLVPARVLRRIDLLKCPKCDYSLWNITPGPCPECGHLFQPSDFDFKPGAVAFTCDSCAQTYFGSSRRGHLEPKTFTCVSCDRSLDMDDMAIMPVEGFVGSHMLQQVIPWSPSRGNLLKRWFLMLGASLGAPVRLAQGLPPTRGLFIGIIFLLVNLAVFGLLMALPFYLLTGIALGGMTGTGGGPMLYQAILSFVLLGGTFIFGMLVITLIVGLLVHVMIVLTGRHEKGLSVTLASLMVTSGPLCVLVVPCLGLYASPVIIIWWFINSVLALQGVHGISTFRSLMCALVPMVLIVGGFISLVILGL